jgi:hypothetical protein
MTHEADRLARLVRELIDLSRLQGGEPLPELVPVEVDTVIAEAVDRTKLAATAKQITIVSGGEGGLVVRGVESQLATAVTNLLANAVAYSPEHPDRRGRPGPGRLRGDHRDRQRHRHPAEDRSRVFERFYRVDQSRASRTGGTGLGLAIVKHVATNHGGSVSVWSEEGLGSTFTLRIPLAAADTPATPDPPATRRPSTTSPAVRPPLTPRGTVMTRVLVVEDEESFSDALSYMLRKEGFDAVVATRAGGARRVRPRCADVGAASTSCCRPARHRGLPAAALPRQRGADHHADRQGRRVDKVVAWSSAPTTT